LVHDFATVHPVLGILGSVRGQQHTHHVASIAFGLALLHNVLRKSTHIVKIGAELEVLAFGKVPQEAEQELGDVLPGRFEDEVRRGAIKRRRRGYFGLFPSATKTGARPELAQGLKELTTSSHTSLKAPSLRHPATQDEDRNRLNEETKINAWAPQLRSEENAER
jgi:hypothetical protein